MQLSSCENFAILPQDTRCETLANGTCVYISKAHRFGADALLLAAFCNVRRREAVCDLGTGCGVIPLRWYDRGHRGPCTAVEIAPEGVALLRASLQKNQIETITPVCEDLKRFAPPMLFDVISCNPPYFTGGRVSSNAARAGARHELTCTVADVAQAAAPLLRDGGRLCLCHRPERLADVICAMRAVRIEPKRLRFVCAKPGRTPFLLLCEGQKNRAPGLRLMPELVMQRAQGGLTREVAEIYGVAYHQEEEPT